jgi:xanthine dehydrogenase YagS FAD-binding subunit
MKHEIISPSLLVDIKRLPELTDVIDTNGQRVVIGALTKLAQIEGNPELRRDVTALAEAAAIAATPQLRNMATIAGNLLQRPRCWYFRNPQINCWLKGGHDCPARAGENELHAILATGESPCVAVHPSDPAAALLAFGAEVEMRGQNGSRTVPLGQFFAFPTDDRRTETTLEPDEVIVSISLPRPNPGTQSTYLKAMDRKVWAFAVVGVAATARVSDGVIAEASVVLSGVAPIPWVVATAADELVGQEPSQPLFARVAESALAEAAPLTHNGYKVPLAKTLIRRALATVTSHQLPT